MWFCELKRKHHWCCYETTGEIGKNREEEGEREREEEIKRNRKRKNAKKNKKWKKKLQISTHDKTTLDEFLKTLTKLTCSLINLNAWFACINDIAGMEYLVLDECMMKPFDVKIICPIHDCFMNITDKIMECLGY